MVFIAKNLKDLATKDDILLLKEDINKLDIRLDKLDSRMDRLDKYFFGIFILIVGILLKGVIY